MQVSSFSRCSRIRVVVTPVMKSHEAFRSPHRSSSDDTGGGGRRRHDQCFEPRFLLEHDLFGKPEVHFSGSCSVSVRRKRKAERRQTHSPLHLPVQRAPCKGALAYRRSTTVLARGTADPKGSGPGQASWDVVCAGVTRHRLSQSSGSTPRTGRNAGEHDARTRPGATVTSRRPRAPHPASSAGVAG
jgi:hypothetical protein